MIAAIIQARMGSTRLPGKIMLPLAGRSVLSHVVERVKRVKGIDTIIVATTTLPEDDALEAFCHAEGYACFRGSADDVLSRYYEAARTVGATGIIRITSDCPLIDPDTIERCIKQYQSGEYDYVSSFVPDERTFPRGLDTEIFSFAALERANSSAKEKYEREHVTPYIWENKKGEFNIGPMLRAMPPYDRADVRLTLDYPEDYELLKQLYDRFYVKEKLVSVPEVLKYLSEHPEIPAINAFREAEYPKQGIRV